MKYLIAFSQKMAWLRVFRVSVCEILRVEKLQRTSDPAKNTLYFKEPTLANASSEPNNS